MVQAPGALGPATAKMAWRGHKRDPSPGSVNDPKGRPRCRRAGEVPGHSPGDRPRTSGGLTEGSVRSARAASEEAQGDREARDRPGTEEPTGRSQQGCHGSVDPTAGCTFG